MNLSDFSKEFDLGYNNALSFSAPPINVYMKSLFLTQEQESIVRERYPNFEKSEEVREQLRNLVRTDVINYDSSLNEAITANRFSLNSKFFEVDEKVWFILSETINGDVMVVPTPIDEYHINIKNPYKMPKTGVRAWRLDVGTDSYKVREIVYPDSISTYTIRYLQKPEPIILENLAPYGVSIEEKTDPTTCKLSTQLHRLILEGAIQRAVLAYKENTLQARVQLGDK